MKVYEKLRFMRQSKGWSQEKMADKLGMSVNGYANIERGETDVSFSRLEQIAKVLEVELLELLSFGERNVFYLATVDNLRQVNPGGTRQPNRYRDKQAKLQQVLEQMSILLKQRESELEYLKEVVNLIRK